MFLKLDLHNQEQRQIQYCCFFISLTVDYMCSISTLPPVPGEISGWSAQFHHGQDDTHSPGPHPHTN